MSTTFLLVSETQCPRYREAVGKPEVVVVVVVVVRIDLIPILLFILIHVQSDSAGSLVVLLLSLASFCFGGISNSEEMSNTVDVINVQHSSLACLYGYTTKPPLLAYLLAFQPVRPSVCLPG